MEKRWRQVRQFAGLMLLSATVLTLEVRPTTDDWPYFFIRDRWFSFMPNFSFSLLLFILGILTFFVLLFLVVPLVVFRRQGARVAGALLSAVALYLLALLIFRSWSACAAPERAPLVNR